MTLKPDQFHNAFERALDAADLDATAPSELGEPVTRPLELDLSRRRSHLVHRRPALVAAVVIAVAGLAVGGALVASQSAGDKQQFALDSPADSTVGWPTRAQIETEYAASLLCLEEAGVEVSHSAISITKFDVAVDQEIDLSNSAVDAEAADDVIAGCKAGLTAMSEAWTMRAGPLPTEKINTAFEKCIQDEGTEPSSVATVQESDPQLFGECMSRARHEVLGTDE